MRGGELGKGDSGEQDLENPGKRRDLGKLFDKSLKPDGLMSRKEEGVGVRKGAGNEREGRRGRGVRRGREQGEGGWERGMGVVEGRTRG